MALRSSCCGPCLPSLCPWTLSPGNGDLWSLLHHAMLQLLLAPCSCHSSAWTLSLPFWSILTHPLKMQSKWFLLQEVLPASTAPPLPSSSSSCSPSSVKWWLRVTIPVSFLHTLTDGIQKKQQNKSLGANIQYYLSRVCNNAIYYKQLSYRKAHVT